MAAAADVVLALAVVADMVAEPHGSHRRKAQQFSAPAAVSRPQFRSYPAAIARYTAKPASSPRPVVAAAVVDAAAAALVVDAAVAAAAVVAAAVAVVVDAAAAVAAAVVTKPAF